MAAGARPPARAHVQGALPAPLPLLPPGPRLSRCTACARGVPCGSLCSGCEGLHACRTLPQALPAAALPLRRPAPLPKMPVLAPVTQLLKVAGSRPGSRPGCLFLLLIVLIIARLSTPCPLHACCFSCCFLPELCLSPVGNLRGPRCLPRVVPAVSTVSPVSPLGETCESALADPVGKPAFGGPSVFFSPPSSCLQRLLSLLQPWQTPLPHARSGCPCHPPATVCGTPPVPPKCACSLPVVPTPDAARASPERSHRLQAGDDARMSIHST